MGRNSSALQQVPKALVLALVRAYQLGVSPFTTPSCRYWPSCSEYVRQSFEDHPFWTASRYAVGRLCRCHPWGGSGFDPVPTKTQQHTQLKDT